MLNQTSPAEKSRCIKLYTNADVKAGQPVKVGAITGTAISAEDADGYTVVDTGKEASFKHSVRNVMTYNGGTEATYAAETQGKRVYYDASSTMPAGTYLSTSPLDKDGNANEKFGKVLTYGLTTATEKTEADVNVIQDNA